MSGTIRLIYTKRPWNPISFGIRCALPQSLFKPAASSHVIIADGNDCLEAHMLHGVRPVSLDEALKGLTVVRIDDHRVPDAEAGLSWGYSQIGAPYDWPGAFGLGLDPERDWQNPEAWFCYEFGAGVLAKAGKDVFVNKGHVTGTMLMAIKP
jgi:hypothetical protein